LLNLDNLKRFDAEISSFIHAVKAREQPNRHNLLKRRSPSAGAIF